MVLLDPDYSGILVRPVFHVFVQFGPDRAWVTVMTIRRDTRGGDAGHGFGRSKECLRRLHIALLAQPDVDKGTKTINGTIKITPVSIHLDVCLVNVPTLSDPAFTLPPEAIDQSWRQLRFPVPDSFVAEFDSPDQEHLRQIMQAQFVPEAPEDHQRDDVGRVLSVVENSTAALIELLSTNTAPEAPVTARSSLRRLGNLRRVALNAPHFPFPHPGGSYAGRALSGQLILARRMTEPAYERIELPPIKLDVMQVHLFGGRCVCSGERVSAEAPAGLEPGSPFGQSIAALVVYLHYAQAIGMERLSTLMDEIFSLSISEGAISNMLARARQPLLAPAETIRATVLASPVICSDETSARVSGKNWWEWVFIGTLAVLHVIRPSRGKAVVQALFGEIRPLVWVSDMLGSQRGHAVEWQVCLSHLLRDATYAIECGDTAFSAAFKRLLLRAIAIGRRRDALKDITLTQYLADLDRQLSRIMAAGPIGEPERKLRKCIAANRAHLFVFIANRSVPYTNNVSERHLRPRRDIPQGDQRIPLPAGSAQ